MTLTIAICDSKDEHSIMPLCQIKSLLRQSNNSNQVSKLNYALPIAPLCLGLFIACDDVQHNVCEEADIGASVSHCSHTE